MVVKEGREKDDRAAGEPASEVGRPSASPIASGNLTSGGRRKRANIALRRSKFLARGSVAVGVLYGSSESENDLLLKKSRVN